MAHISCLTVLGPCVAPCQGREVAGKLAALRSDTAEELGGREWHPSQFKGGVCGEHGGALLDFL